MPTISTFFGVTVQMYWTDHAPPHVHAFYAGFEALFAIETGANIGGRLPPKVEKLVRDWVLAHGAELMDNWTLGRRELPFNRVPGADA
jgi:hypothetical protein